MKTHLCRHPRGEVFTLHQNDAGMYLCPVCGSPEFSEPPYSDAGSPLFEMCSCGFEFGYDDSPSATSSAVEGIAANWKRYRRELIDEAATDSDELRDLELNLANIGRRLAFDLIDVPIKTEENKSLDTKT